MQIHLSNKQLDLIEKQKQQDLNELHDQISEALSKNPEELFDATIKKSMHYDARSLVIDPAARGDYITRGVPAGHCVAIDGEIMPMRNAKRTSIAERVLIKAQNVHDYFTKHFKEHGWEDITTFTCAKPPYKNILISYDHAYYVSNEEDLVVGVDPMIEKKPHIPKEFRHVDLIVTELSVEEFSKRMCVDLKLHESILSIVDDCQPASMIGFKMVVDGEHEFPGDLFVMIDEHGQILSRKEAAFFYVPSLHALARIRGMKNTKGEYLGKTPEELYTAVSSFRDTLALNTSIALATLQFMNIRNVEIVEHVPTRQQRRHAEREGKRPPVTYKTLVIHPIGKRHVYAKLETLNHGVPMHIVRGHFKDYRRGKGLGRGHRRGIWWWSATVRGSEEYGRIVKDYEVDEK